MSHKRNKRSAVWKVQSSGDLFPAVLTKKEIIRNLHQISRKLIRRLIKLANFPDCKYCDKWMNEVYVLLHNISKLPNLRLPSSTLIYNNVYRCSVDLIRFWDIKILDDYTDLLGKSSILLGSPDGKALELQSRISKYLKRLSSILASEGEISKKDCKFYIKHDIQNRQTSAIQNFESLYIV